MTTQKDFIKIELKKKLLELRRDYYIANSEILKALAEIANDIKVKQSLESRLDSNQANNAFNGIAGEFRSS